MKKGIFGVLIVSIFILMVNFIMYNNKIIYVNSVYNGNNNDTLAIMLESSFKSGEYDTSSDNAWPSSGYTFNSSLSKCENGSSITWDEAMKNITVSGNASDKCYVYFDVFIPDIKFIYKVNNGNSDENLLYDINSTTVDEVGIMINSINSKYALNLNGKTITKNSSASNIDYVYKYGINSAIFIENSNYNIKNGYVKAYGNGALGFYVKDSFVVIDNCVVDSLDSSVPAMIINNSEGDLIQFTFNFDNIDTSALILKDSFINIRGSQFHFNYMKYPLILIDNSSIAFADTTFDQSSTSFLLKNKSMVIFNNSVGNTTFEFELENNSDVHITNNENINLNLNIKENAKLSLQNVGSFTGSIKSNYGDIIDINNSGSFYGCINPSNKGTVNFKNNSNLYLICDSYVSVFDDNTDYQAIDANGHNIYYDRNSNPHLNGQTISLYGGGNLLPYN